MKIYAINGSPRKKFNTAKLLDSALQGASDAAREQGQGAETKRIDLYGLRYTGCTSCFACKRLDGPSYGRCAVKDDLHDLLPEISEADALIIGSPIYLGDITGQLRSFLERLVFPYLVYDTARTTLSPRHMPVGMIYTMNLPDSMMRDFGYPTMMDRLEDFVGNTFVPPLRLCVTDTLQFDDYSKYKMEVFSAEAKKIRHQDHFPRDLQDARDLGARLVKSR